MESSDSTFAVANVYTLDKQNLSLPSKCFSFIEKTGRVYFKFCQ